MAGGPIAARATLAAINGPLKTTITNCRVMRSLIDQPVRSPDRCLGHTGERALPHLAGSTQLRHTETTVFVPSNLPLTVHLPVLLRQSMSITSQITHRHV